MYGDGTRRNFEKISAENITLKERIQDYQDNNKRLRDTVKRLKNAKFMEKEKYEQIIAEKDAIIKELKNRLEHELALKNHDSSNTGTPTSQTPINKKKKVPNSREKSGRMKGGQPGHVKHSMEAFEDFEITETVTHELDTAAEKCGFCGGTLIFTGDIIAKDEFDIEINVIKRRHEYYIYECSDCGACVRLSIDAHLKEQNQYGSTMQALALSMMVTGNMAINKVKMLMEGITGGEMKPCEGFICKLYKRAACLLGDFITDLKMIIISKELLYWDDTTVMIKTNRACIRFYGDETVSYYTAHLHKDMDSLMDDGILPLLTPETTVMHDHNKINYNEQFCFRNIECNQHLQRDLQKIADDNPEHTWAAKAKELISKTIKKRKEAIAAGKTEFKENFVSRFFNKMECLLKTGWDEREKYPHMYEAAFEAAVLRRIKKYMDNYFEWVRNFNMPTTDNLSERGLRCIKSHMKISGQFESEKTAGYYAAVKTYVETCKKNHINEMDALLRLISGNPYSVKEIFA